MHLSISPRAPSTLSARVPAAKVHSWSCGGATTVRGTTAAASSLMQRQPPVARAKGVSTVDLILSIGVLVGFVCLYAVRTVIRMRKGNRAIVDETRLDALRRIEQAK